MRRNEKGVVQVFAIIVAGALLVILLSVFIFSQKGDKKLFTIQESTEETTVAKEMPISDSDKTTDIEAELDSTDVGDFESDIDSLENEAVTL